jgi:phosphoribosylcarboxyaminoimidazole (NCAIR) mutase
MNAGILAAQILGVADASIAKKLEAHKQKMARGVEEKSKRLKDGEITAKRTADPSLRSG